MTDEQINVAITEVTGLWDHPYSSDTRVMMDFCRDLNAMHQAENYLGESANMVEYTNALYDMACVVQMMTGRCNPYGLPARYRAEAFLRTLGKWEDGE